jgi:hypothetical protein
MKTLKAGLTIVLNYLKTLICEEMENLDHFYQQYQ